MSQYVLLSSRDVPESVWIFYHMGTSGKMEVRPEYQHLCCPSCKKFDERKALSLGISREIRTRVITDLFESDDGVYIVSTRLRDLFRTIEEAQISFVEMPSCPTHHVAMPNVVYLPIPGDPAYRMDHQCPRCGRWREVVWGSVPPPVNQECKVGMFQLENRKGIMASWLVDAGLAAFLQRQKPKLKGLLFAQPPYRIEDIRLSYVPQKYGGHI